MKRSLKTKLDLRTETLRALAGAQLTRAAGANINKTVICTITCANLCNVTDDCPVVTHGNCTQLCWEP